MSARPLATLDDEAVRSLELDGLVVVAGGPQSIDMEAFNIWLNPSVLPAAETRNDPAGNDIDLAADVAGQRHLYFAALANGNSKMYRSDEMRTCVQRAGLRIERDGSEYVLNGTKVWISMAGPSVLYTVLAKTDKGPTAFIVDTTNPGFTSSRELDKMEAVFQAMAISLLQTQVALPR